ncbi:MAG: Valine-tRNA ligase [Parcubacteria group bacterium GW2011_GWB1_43_66]|nr:MAG: Valine-tRNA ligase [Parcubacteria group bacterium GW2011_GWB1_43_66]
MPELPKAYLPQNYETQIYRQWEQSGFFNPDNLLKKGEPFSISLPPPNATGILHLGHAVMIAIQDLVCAGVRPYGCRAKIMRLLPPKM